MDEADFIVVGAGSAGCLLANRLSAKPAHRVVLLEAGPRDRDPLLRIPLLSAVHSSRASLNWGYETEPQEALGGKRIPLPRGKVLGGTSSINAMMVMRGHACDYDDWAAAGLDGWSYADVLPHFKAFERNLSHPGADQYHGRAGELATEEAPGLNPLYRPWLAAAEAAGFKRNHDFNGMDQEGVGYHDFNIAAGRRVSAATAFLHPIAARKNLRVITGAQVTRLRFDGRRCTGVDYRRGDIPLRLSARKEIILAAGVFNSPQLLQLSGIGDGVLLRRHGIDVVVEQPEVGRNFQDHTGLFVEWACLKPVSLYALFRPDRIFAALVRAYFFGTGPAARVPLEAGGMVRTRPDHERPDIQLTFAPGLPLPTLNAGRHKHGFLTSLCLLRPKSRGSVEIRSADPLDKPRIQPNYLSVADDVATLRDAVKVARAIVAQAPLNEYRGVEIAPGDAVRRDADLEAWVRQTASTLWHGSSTCRMGADEGAVVDKTLNVRGVANLRIADASVMPNIIGGNTSVPVMMIAEKGAALILQG